MDCGWPSVRKLARKGLTGITPDEVGVWEITTRFPHARFLTNSKLPTRRELFRVVVPRRKSASPLRLPLPRDEEESYGPTIKSELERYFVGLVLMHDSMQDIRNTNKPHIELAPDSVCG